MIEIYRFNGNERLLLPQSSHWNKNLQRIPTGEKRDIAILNIARLFDSEWLAFEQLITQTATGRGKVYFFEAMKEKCVLRHYYRGGLAAKVSNDSFVYTSMKETRAYKEMSILTTLYAAELSVPKPLAARVVKKGLSYRADIITSEIEESRELHALLQEMPLDKPLWRAIGTSIRKMHNAQAYHPDINVKNVLVQLPDSEDLSKNMAALKQQNTKVSLLDFDNCKIRSGESWKIENLGRFRRSLDKQLAKCPSYHFEEEHWHWLEQGYEF